MQNFEHYLDLAVEYIAAYSPKLLLAILVLIFGLIGISWVVKVIKNAMEKKGIDLSLRNFLSSLISITLKILLIISVVSMVGIETTSFIAVIGAAGLAVGLALQGSLSNFAGGVLILFLKPFRVGDYIEAQGHGGTVHEVQIIHTILKTPDNKTIILPNGPLANNDIVNYTQEATRRIDFTFGIGYGDDITKAKEIINSIILNDERILKDPEPLVAVGALADSSVNITTRVWCKKEEYWNIHWDMFEKIKNEFDTNGISIPFPQRDIHVINEK